MKNLKLKVTFGKILTILAIMLVFGILAQSCTSSRGARTGCRATQGKVGY